MANTTGHPKVFYVGHSQGSTQLYAYLCSDLSLQSYIRAFIGLGPAVYIDHLVKQHHNKNISLKEAIFDNILFTFRTANSWRHYSNVGLSISLTPWDSVIFSIFQDQFPRESVHCAINYHLSTKKDSSMCLNCSLDSTKSINCQEISHRWLSPISLVAHLLRISFIGKDYFGIMRLHICLIRREQFMRTGEFKKYDFGKEKNLKIYGTE